MVPKSFDHVALWIDERDELTALLTECCGMHVISRTDAFTLVGGDAREGKLTLFAAEGPRERGVLDRVTLRVADLEDTRSRLEQEGHTVERDGDTLLVAAPSGVTLALVERAGAFPDLDGVVLRVPDPAATSSALTELGIRRDGDRLYVEDREIVLVQADAHEGDRPLLNHLAFLVDSARSVEDEARSRGLEIDEVVDAANTLAVFLRGPDRIRLEYVEHKPEFALT